MTPHFTGALSTAALVHVLGSSSPTRCLTELWGGRSPPYFNEDLINLKKGELYPSHQSGQA